MESRLQELAREAIRHPNIKGFMCIDSRGMCVCAEGSANEKSSGIIATIASLAAKLEPNATKSPVISIESEKTKILIQSKDSITTAIYKNTSSHSPSSGSQST